jgi:hypothetical protein
MNNIRILIVGLLAVSAASLCSAETAAPPVVPAEKIIDVDVLAVDVQQSFDIALCDLKALNVEAIIERDAVVYADTKPSIAAGRAGTYAKVSAHGRMCGSPVASHAAANRSKPLTYYEQRT